MNGRYNMTYYPNKSFNPFQIDLYKNIMLSKETKDASTYAGNVMYDAIIEEIDQLPNVEPVVEEKKEEYFQPKQPDTLFWCLYILHHGMNDYRNIGYNYGVKELEEKQRLAAFIRENISRIKGTNHKITNVLIQEILSELLTSQKETSLQVLTAITVFYNMNIFIVDSHDRCMLEFLANKDVTHDAQTYVLYKDKFGKYRVQLEWISSNRILELREKYIVLENFMRPMKAVSTYKTDELIELARRFSLYDENKKYKKSELYDAVHKLCKWT